MKTLVTATALAGAMTALTTASSTQAEMPSTVLEIVAYRVTDPITFTPRRSETAMRLAREQTALLWWQRFSSADGLMVDVLAWPDLSSAQQAAAYVAGSENYAPFRRSISEVQFFGHLTAPVDPSELLADLQKGPMTELALYTVRDPDTHRSIQATLHAEILEREGVYSASSLISTDGDIELFGDLLTFKDRASWEETGSAMMAKPDYEAFFSGMSDTLVFTLLTKDMTP